MKRRCSLPTSTQYRWYGGKGIRVCAEWQAFVAFRDWAMANGYQDGLSIDRIDSSRQYEPGNCQWISRSANSRTASRFRITKGRLAAMAEALLAA